MIPSLFRWPVHQAVLSALALLTLATSAAQAQPQAAATAPQATAMSAEAALPYQSVFGAYQKFSDEPVAPWPQTNATVEKIGGWRVYAKEARQPDAADQAATPKSDAKPDTKPDTKPVPSPNTGAHGDHGGKP